MMESLGALLSFPTTTLCLKIENKNNQYDKRFKCHETYMTSTVRIFNNLITIGLMYSAS